MPLLKDSVIASFLHDIEREELVVKLTGQVYSNRYLRLFSRSRNAARFADHLGGGSMYKVRLNHSLVRYLHSTHLE